MGSLRIKATREKIIILLHNGELRALGCVLKRRCSSPLLVSFSKVLNELWTFNTFEIEFRPSFVVQRL
jgi:hypothetical protein